MYISNTLKNYLVSSIKIFNSNVIITNFDSVLFSATIYSSNNFNIKDSKISNDLKSLLKEWKIADTSLKESSIILNNNYLQLIEDDVVPYSAQMIFPLCHNNKLDGLIIFYRTVGNYIKSSPNAVRAVREFTEQFSEDSFVDKEET